MTTYLIQRSSCHNHKAVNAVNTNRNNLESTGIGACACARHGCFVPHSVVDFQKGERYVKLKGTINSMLIIYYFPRQMNMDYSICNALAYQTEPMNSGLIIYDVACQWSLNFHRRVQDSDFLSLGHITDLIPAVGKFHLAAHVPSCFARFSLNFVQGAGQLDGEILETLWSEFNKVSASTCSMSKAHRAEVYDDHMRDSNWKKLVGMGE